MITAEQKALITDMRNDDIGYRTIAKELGLNQKQVENHCQRNNLGGFRALSDDGLKIFEERFNVKYSGVLEYISGYSGHESTVIVRCLKCGTFSDRCAQMARKKSAVVICGQCCINANEQKKRDRKALIEERNKERERLRVEVKALKEAERIKNNTKHCASCNDVFIGTATQLYCNKACSMREQTRRKDIRRRQKLNDNGYVDYSITLTKLIIRDNGLCKLCGEVVDMDADSNSNHYPSIDHIVPVVKGGTHTWDNVQLAHRICNSLKGADD